MSNLRQAAQQALDALGCAQEETRSSELKYSYGVVITALRAALAEPVSDTLPPLPEPFTENEYGERAFTADQIRSYAAAALAAAVAEPVAIHQWRTIGCADWYDGHSDHSDGGGPYETRTLYAAPPQREPYDQTALGLCNACGWKAVGPDGCLNCAPQREPLTDEQIDAIILRLMDTTGANLRNVARAVERVILEKSRG